jgi:hypothetical protein
VRYYTKQTSGLAGGNSRLAIVEKRLLWSPTQIGIDLSSPGYYRAPANSSFIDGSALFTNNANWIISLGDINRNITVDLGGKNAVVMGFSIHITFDPTTDYSRAITGRRAVLFQNFASLHVEGFTIDGTTASDGIDLGSSLPNSKVQLQNFRVEGLTEPYYDTGNSAALITNSDGSQPQYNHPDVIQTFGGPSILRVGNFYAASDRSLMTISTSSGANITELSVRNGHYKQTPHPVLGNQRTYPFFWNQAAGESNSFPINMSNLYYEHGTGARTRAEGFFPDGDTRYLTNVLLGNIAEGAPPSDNSFVPKQGSVGVGYTSPGYMN